jgi:hypothetical protein
MGVTRLTPGTTGRLNHRCRWPERCGLRAVVVDVTGNDVAVHIDRDLVPPSTLPNGQPYSCVIDARSFDPIVGGGAS